MRPQPPSPGPIWAAPWSASPWRPGSRRRSRRCRPRCPSCRRRCRRRCKRVLWKIRVLIRTEKLQLPVLRFSWIPTGHSEILMPNEVSNTWEDQFQNCPRTSICNLAICQCVFWVTLPFPNLFSSWRGAAARTHGQTVLHKRRSGKDLNPLTYITRLPISCVSLHLGLIF